MAFITGVLMALSKHIFTETILNKYGKQDETTQQWYNTKKIKNGENILLIIPITEMTNAMHEKFHNHTLLGKARGRNFYAFDTGAGIILIYPPIPFHTHPATQASEVYFYEDKDALRQSFLPNNDESSDDYQYHHNLYATILENIKNISTTHDDSNSLNNVFKRLNSIRESTAPLLFKYKK